MNKYTPFTFFENCKEKGLGFAAKEDILQTENSRIWALGLVGALSSPPIYALLPITAGLYAISEGFKANEKETLSEKRYIKRYKESFQRGIRLGEEQIALQEQKKEERLRLGGQLLCLEYSLFCKEERRKERSNYVSYSFPIFS